MTRRKFLTFTRFLSMNPAEDRKVEMILDADLLIGIEEIPDKPDQCYLMYDNGHEVIVVRLDHKYSSASETLRDL